MVYIARRGPFPIIFLVALLIVSLAHKAPAQGQPQQDCGVMDAIDYPIDGISIQRDDFGMFRALFAGNHAGVDLAFGRYGEAVRAAARGRVTFSDPAAWGEEKGVVVIEHNLPNGGTVFSLYGHMEELNGHVFPKVNDCVTRGQIIGAIGNPKLSAKHLHYEIRTMRASTGGPGYAPGEPLEFGWFHPLEFTELWRMRFTAAYRTSFTSQTPLRAMPMWTPDGGVMFAGAAGVEARNGQNQRLWGLSVRGLVGAVALPDGRILGRLSTGQVLIMANGRFEASWQADRPLRFGPFRMADAIVFIDEQNRVVGYDGLTGAIRWQTDPLSPYLERHIQSGDYMAITGQKDGAFRLWVIGPDGKIAYEGSAPAPVVPAAWRDANGQGFLLMVGSQVALLRNGEAPIAVMDVGQAIGRGASAVLDSTGSLYLYPGIGSDMMAFNADGSMRWRTRLAVAPLQPPMMAVGGGCLVYVLNNDGALFAYRAADGVLTGVTSLYAGGGRGDRIAQFIEVLPDEQVRFSAGYLSVATVDGLALSGVPSCP
jgi:murein DD-endopeptidase MepM/ murein hydrolase activator NlpD